MEVKSTVTYSWQKDTEYEWAATFVYLYWSVELRDVSSFSSHPLW